MYDDDTMNRAANFTPYYLDGPTDDRTVVHPCIDIHGVGVYVYVKNGELVVSLHFDGDPDVWDQQNIPLRILTGAREPLYVVDQDGFETFGDAAHRVADLAGKWDKSADGIDVEPHPVHGFDSWDESAAADMATVYRECAAQLRKALTNTAEVKA